MGERVAAEPFAFGIPQTLYVEPGAEEAVELLSEEGKVLDTVAPGEVETVSVPYSEIHAPMPATVYVEYQPGPAEGLSTQALRLEPLLARLPGKKIYVVSPQEGFNGQSGDEDSRPEVQKFLREQLNTDITIISFNEALGFSSIQNRSFVEEKDALIVVLSTQRSYDSNALSDSFAKTLLSRAVKMPAFKDVEKLKNNDRFFIIDHIARGLALAAGINEDGRVDAKDMPILESIVMELTGLSREEITNDHIYGILPFDTFSGMLSSDLQTLAAVVQFIHDLLMHVPVKPETPELRNRMRAKRKLDYSL